MKKRRISDVTGRSEALGSIIGEAQGRNVRDMTRALEAENAVLASRCAEMQRANEQLAGELGDLSARMGRLRASLGKKRRSSCAAGDRLEAALRDGQEKISELVETVNGLRESLAAKTEELADVRSGKILLENKCRELEAENEELRARVAVLEAEVLKNSFMSMAKNAVSPIHAPKKSPVRASPLRVSPVRRGLSPIRGLRSPAKSPKRTVARRTKKKRTTTMGAFRNLFFTMDSTTDEEVTPDVSPVRRRKSKSPARSPNDSLNRRFDDMRLSIN